MTLKPINISSAETLGYNNKAKKEVLKTENNENNKVDRKKVLLATLSAMGTIGIASFAILKSKSLSKIKATVQKAKNQYADEVSKEIKETAEDVVQKTKSDITKSADDAKLAAEKAKQEAAEKAAEEAKIAAEKAKQEAAQKAAEEAKIAAEKAKQEAAQKAAEKAKIAADKLHQKAITALDDVSKKYTTNEIDWNLPVDKLEAEIIGKYNSRFGKTTSITNEMISVLEEAEKNGTKVSVAELKKALTDAMTDPDGMEKLSEKLTNLKTQKFGELYEKQKKLAEETIKKYPECNYDLNSLIETGLNGTINTIGERIQYIGNKNEYLKRIINRIETTPKAEQQKTSEYLKEIISTELKSEQAKKAAFNSQIKSILKYTDDTADELIELTKQEKQELADYFNELFKTNEFNVDTDIGYMASKWKHKYISGFTPDLPEKTELALMRKLGRACPDVYYKDFPTIKPDFEHAPLCRWMKIHDLKGFLKQFENSSREYGYNRIQSFSKNFNQGEWHSFTDWQECYNVKLIIHPKAKSGKTLATDLGAGKYGNMEAIYPRGQKFKFLGKTKVTSSNADFPNHDPFDAFYRWEIHLQEI